MAPIKLEEHIREQLQDREIHPSSNSWNKLNSQLQDKPKKNNRNTWIYLAASIISIALITSLFLREETKIKPSENIVTIPDKIENEIQKSSNDIKKLLKEKENENRIVVVETPTKKKQNEIITTAKQTEKLDKKDNLEETFAANEVIIKSEEELIIDAKVNEVVAQINNLNESSTPISDEEINGLLLKAQQELQSKRILKANRVDAQELLSVVEYELEESFRDRVFEALGEGFKKVRTAVVDRNQ